MHDFTSPDYYLEQWKLMNQEMAEEGTPLSINIPTMEEVKEWLKRDALSNQTIEESRELRNEKGSEKDS
tara:strand:+ start:293 stop:499 length:207 start_codon:yes stop_codon:yes gene_type:complete